MKLPVAILAGGLATRLGPLVEKIPKSLLEVAGKPFAAHQLELLARHGIDHVVFCVGHHGEQIVQALGDGRRWSMRVEYIFDGPILLGTAGALKRAVPLLGDAFLILHGDAYLKCDYADVANRFLESGKLGLMTVFHNANRWDHSNIVYSNGRILQYDKFNRTPAMTYIDYGLGALHSGVFDDYKDGEPLDLFTVYQNLIVMDELLAFEVPNRFYEIGSVEGLRETRGYLSQKI